ncbi:MAG: polymer-forming cytoskeletal protein [Acidobacteria bacterium]|nr:polymer-forming cytoskeletal protein [Acidobacteriota bacterium]
MTAGKTVSTIGDSIVIKGELIANEDLVLEGRVEGKITSKRNVLTVGEHGSVEATIVGSTVVVAGKVRGDITAAEKIDFRDTGSVEGDIAAPVVVMAPGVRFLGGIDMPQPQGAERTAARGRDRR